MKIHPLRGKAKPCAVAAKYLPASQTHHRELSEISNVTHVGKLTKPILFRYIDPRLVPLFKELNTLTHKC